MAKESGTRELDLRDKCNRCGGIGGWMEPNIQIFTTCDTCEGEGKISFYPTEKQKEHQKLWAKAR